MNRRLFLSRLGALFLAPVAAWLVKLLPKRKPLIVECFPTDPLIYEITPEELPFDLVEAVARTDPEAAFSGWNPTHHGWMHRPLSPRREA